MSADGLGVYTPPGRRIGGSGNDVDSNQGGHELVVQQVKEAGVTLRYPMLSENNYGVWAVKMKIFMRAQGVWAAVEGDKVVDEKKDQMALAAIIQAVPEAVVMAISGKETAKEAWDALKEMHVGEERVKKARVQTLKREFDRISMGDSEKITEFALKLTTLVNEIRTLGTKVEENAVVEKLLRSVPDKFLPIVSTIEQWGDVSAMSVMEAIGRLRAYEESLKGRRRNNEEGEHLLLTRAEWEAKTAEEKRSGEGTGSGTKNGGHVQDGDKKKHRGKFDKSKIQCFNCREFGHFASECDKPKKERAFFAAVDADNEPTLL